MAEACIGCGAVFPHEDGPLHPYMLSSAACFRHFTNALAAEYSDPALMETHRLTVDTFAVQHPGLKTDRRAIQSVGLHLTRLKIQLSGQYTPYETNDIMLGLGEFKHEMHYLEPPTEFKITIKELSNHLATEKHPNFVRDWAEVTWTDWSDHHPTIQKWINRWQVERR
jgi:hypothetical protein